MKVVDKENRNRISESRRGIDIPKKQAKVALVRIKERLSRNLFLYKISQFYAYNGPGYRQRQIQSTSTGNHIIGRHPIKSGSPKGCNKRKSHLKGGEWGKILSLRCKKASPMGATSYPPTDFLRSTLGDGGLNCRVRNGTG